MLYNEWTRSKSYFVFLIVFDKCPISNDKQQNKIPHERDFPVISSAYIRKERSLAESYCI